MLKNVVNQYFFATVGANHAQMERLRESLTAMVTGWSVDQVKEIINESIHSAIGPMIYDEAATLIEKHISDGRDIIIVSTSGKEIVEPIGKLLGATTVIATEMIIEDGKYTGAVAFYAYGEKKAEAIKKLAAEKGYDLSLSFAYSDSVTDLPMLKSVGFPCAVNPDRALRAEAEKLDWPILSFSRSVPLRDRLWSSTETSTCYGAEPWCFGDTFVSQKAQGRQGRKKRRESRLILDLAIGFRKYVVSITLTLGGIR